jgi:hypothetical protein
MTANRQSPDPSLPGHTSAGLDDRQLLFDRFRAALTAGNYNAIVGRGPRRSLRAAAADTSLEPEIGALRLALLRLLNEERDPGRLAAGIARLSSVAIQAARHRSGTDSGGDELRQTLLRELEIFEREKEMEAASHHPETPGFASDGFGIR